MIAADQTQSWVDQYLSIEHSNVSWLDELQQKAIAKFRETGLPGVRDEEWRYTNLRKLKSHSFALSQPKALELKLPISDNPRLVFIDGLYSDEHSNANAIDYVGTLSSTLRDGAEIISQQLNSTIPDAQHGFTMLNTAYAKEGYVVHLNANTVSKEVIEIIFVSQSENVVAHTRNLIIAEANTQCTVVERHIGKHGAVYLNNSVTEIIAKDNAHVDHYKIQQESDEAFHVGGIFIEQARDSHVKSHGIALQGAILRNDVKARLAGQGAHTEMNGLVLGSGQQHVDNHTEVSHLVPNCTSDEYYKSVLDDSSRSVFKGRIIVAEDAQLTVADQQNNNLLLSKNAEADTKPQLEIYADDVKCSHGATVGQLDQTALFYLKTRGIDDISARNLLTFAFANEVVERVKVPSIEAELKQLIAGELLAGLEELI